MDNFRLKITNIDKSQGLSIADKGIKAFTIVDAPKGPQKPFYIPAGKYTTIGEVFGYPSADYTELQEVFDVNSGYGLWVSAPYDPVGSEVPVAYVTPAGIFRGHDLVTLSTAEYLEDISEDDLLVEGISSLSSDLDILIPVGQETKLFTSDSTTVGNTVTYDVTDKLAINLSFDVAAELAATGVTQYHFLNSTEPSVTGGQVMKSTTADVGVITFIIPGKDPLDISVESSGGNIELKTGATGSGQSIGTIVISGEPDSKVLQLRITGAAEADLSGDYKLYFNSATLDTVWSNKDFLESVEVYWKATLAVENVMATIYPKYVSNRTTTLTFAEQDFTNKFKNTITEKIDKLQASYTFAWSLDSSDKDGFGNSLEVSSKIDSQTLVDIHVFKTFQDFKFTKTDSLIGPTDFTLPPVILSGGKRVAVSDTDSFWSLAQEAEFDEVDIFFSVKTPADSSVFFSLDGSHSLSRFVFPKQVLKDSVDSSLAKLAYGNNFWAITGMFSRTSPYTTQPFTSSLIGAYVKMACSAIDLAHGGIAIMYLNNSLGLGGQLDVSVKKALNNYKYGPEELKILDDKNYNPITLSPYGVMVTSHKTCAAGEISDWSYIGHVSAFLDFQREVRQQVMIPQIGKPNNDYYRELRADQVKDLLKKRTEGSDRIWASGSVDTSTTNVNTDDILAQRKFKLVVTVKVDIFSEGVELQFISEGQV